MTVSASGPGLHE